MMDTQSNLVFEGAFKLSVLCLRKDYRLISIKENSDKVCVYTEGIVVHEIFFV